MKKILLIGLLLVSLVFGGIAGVGVVSSFPSPLAFYWGTNQGGGAVSPTEFPPLLQTCGPDDRA